LLKERGYATHAVCLLEILFNKQEIVRSREKGDWKCGGGSAGIVIIEYVGLGECGLEHLFTCDEGNYRERGEGVLFLILAK
jgi:hypothetical protein